MKKRYEQTEIPGTIRKISFGLATQREAYWLVNLRIYNENGDSLLEENGKTVEMVGGSTRPDETEEVNLVSGEHIVGINVSGGGALTSGVRFFIWGTDQALATYRQRTATRMALDGLPDVEQYKITYYNQVDPLLKTAVLHYTQRINKY